MTSAISLGSVPGFLDACVRAAEALRPAEPAVDDAVDLGSLLMATG
ncbi:hypothetical protein [Streptomyces sp. NPDC055140]